jgi:DNA-binding CsgD family transcriptional regulator/tetratricopeptide (TPR) repeat protein
MVLVTGDAGVGKTRLVAEGMARAGAGGMVMIRGECLPLTRTLPLLPIAVALGELAALDSGRLIEAALGVAPGFVHAEVERLVPQLGPGGGLGANDRGEGWQRERLFAAVAELLAVVAGSFGAGVGLVVEDVHWADSETLDFLTFLARAGRLGAVSVVVTCRSDEAPLATQVAEWLARVRGAAAAEEITLGPLSRTEVAGQAAALAGGPVAPALVDELFTRAEGNPFFTEQLAAALARGAAEGELGAVGLPARLGELLVARAGRCAGDARAVLNAMAVAGRPLPEGLLSEITRLEPGEVRRGLRELAAVRLLADDTPGGTHRPRHALLAEAVAGGLLPGERAGLHERAARALEGTGDETLAAEVARHWQVAGRPAGELPARVAAATAAERVFGFAQAAVHWLRVIDLCQAQPGIADAAGINVPGLYVRAVDALHAGGDRARASEVAEEAYRRFFGHTDPAIAALIHLRAAVLREFRSPAAGRPLIETALRLFEACPASAEKADAWGQYATAFLFHAEARLEASRAALNRALEIAEAASSTMMTARVLGWLAVNAFLRGQVDEGFSLLQRGSALAEAAQEDRTGLFLASYRSDALLTLGRFRDAARIAQHGLDAGRQAGLSASSSPATFLAATAAEALMALGCTADAAALIDPLTTGPPDRYHWVTHQARTDIDLLRGDIQAAVSRQRQISSFSFAGSIGNSRHLAEQAAELALWAGRPGDALGEVRQVLPRFQVPDLTILCGRLLTAGMRACADLVERAKARRDEPAAEDAVAAAGGLVSWAEQMGGAPFTDHLFVATIPAERATWEAERTRLAGRSDPAVWAAAAKTWDGLACPHRAAYARWRQVQAHLDAGLPASAATATLRAAAAAASGHQPLLAQVRALAERARIPLQTPAAIPSPPPSGEVAKPYGLTERELAVLRLLAAGRTNAQIGAQLYISPRTAGVHVTNILRKLGVSGRVQAAAVAERAGLLEDQQP